MKRLIFATGNQNKMREIREILADLPVEILSMKEAGIEADIVEDGKTFEENAIIKAKNDHGTDRRTGAGRLIPDWKLTISIKSLEFIPQDIWEKIPLTG